MTRPRFALSPLIVLALCALLAHGRPALQADDGREEEKERLLNTLLSQAGQPERERISPEQVRRAFGAPRRLARQLLYHRYLEQWSYDLTVPLRIEFEFVAGQPPRLVGAQRLRPDGR